MKKELGDSFKPEVDEHNNVVIMAVMILVVGFCLGVLVVSLIIG